MKPFCFVVCGPLIVVARSYSVLSCCGPLSLVERTGTRHDKNKTYNSPKDDFDVSDVFGMFAGGLGGVLGSVWGPFGFHAGV